MLRSSFDKLGMSGKGGPGGARPVRIAHAYGNTRKALQRALVAEIDVIEADVWFRAGQLYVRHEARLDPLPILVDRRMRGHGLPPLSLPLWGRYYVRLDVHAIRLEELLESAAGRRALLLDVKGDYDDDGSEAFARALAHRISEYAHGNVAVCGQFWPVLQRLRENALRPGSGQALEVEVRYSIERTRQWEAFVLMLGEDDYPTRVCIEHRFLNEERARVLAERGVSVYAWTVDNAVEAKRLVQAGVDGVISNDLGLLEELEG